MEKSLRKSSFVLALLLAGCVNLAENYEPAGFAHMGEARPYINDFAYYAKKITAPEWSAFYERFPEYWQDIQSARMLGSSVEFHPAYTAYAFRWNMLRRKEQWPAATVARLDARNPGIGDDVFQLTYSLGPPARIVWNNRAEALLYPSGDAYLMRSGTVWRIAKCPGCTQRHEPLYKTGMTDHDVTQAVDQLIR